MLSFHLISARNWGKKFAIRPIRMVAATRITSQSAADVVFKCFAVGANGMQRKIQWVEDIYSALNTCDRLSSGSFHSTRGECCEWKSHRSNWMQKKTAQYFTHWDRIAREKEISILSWVICRSFGSCLKLIIFYSIRFWLWSPSYSISRVFHFLCPPFTSQICIAQTPTKAFTCAKFRLTLWKWWTISLIVFTSCYF